MITLMRRLLLAALVLALAGCGGATPKPTVSAAPSAARAVTTPSATPTLPSDPQGQRACDDTKAALAVGGLLDPGAMQAVAAAAAQSTDWQVQQSGMFLGRAAERAALAKGQSDDAAMGAGLTVAAMNFSTVCIDRGYGA